MPRRVRSGRLPQLTLVEWLSYAEELLSPEVAQQLRKRVGHDVRLRADRARREAEQLERQWAAITQPEDGASEDADVDEDNDDEDEGDGDEEEDDAESETDGDDLSEWSVARLINRLVVRAPGSTASECVEFIHRYRPDVDPATIHSTLYKECRAGRLRKEGERPNTRYYSTAATEAA